MGVIAPFPPPAAFRNHPGRPRPERHAGLRFLWSSKHLASPAGADVAIL